MNLTKALISLYRKETPDITVLALSGPALPAVVKDNQLHPHLELPRQRPVSYTLKVDGQTVAENLEGEDFTLDLSKLSVGKHTVQLVANGVHTCFRPRARALDHQVADPPARNLGNRCKLLSPRTMRIGRTRIPSPESRTPSPLLKACGILPMCQLVGGEHVFVEGQSRVGVSGKDRRRKSPAAGDSAPPAGAPKTRRQGRAASSP